MAGSAVAWRARCLSWSGLAAIVWLAVAVYGATGETNATGGTYSDEDVKAAFLLRFPSYVTWNEESGTLPALEIAVLGSPAIAAKLRELLGERGGGNRPMQIRSVTRLEDARGAQILFVSAERRVDSRALLELSEGHGLLVITDSERGLSAGGSINFLTVNQRVRFEVSLETARRAGVHISADMLAVAARVQGGRPRPP